MANILIFHKDLPVAFVRGSLSFTSLNYKSSKNKVVSLLIQIIFIPFLNEHCRAVLVASEQPVMITSVINFYNTKSDGVKIIPIKLIGRFIHELERSQKNHVYHEVLLIHKNANQS